MPETTTVQAPIPITPATSQSLIDQYELPDDEFDTPAQPAADAPQARNADGTFAKPPVAEPVKPTHSKLALKLADSFGITPEEAALMAPDALEQTVAALHKQSLHGPAKLSKGEAAGEREPTPTTQPAPSAPLDIGDTSDWHPAIAEAVKKLVAEVNALRGMKSTLDQVQAHVQGQMQETLNQRLDRLFTSHCDPSLIGEGRGADMDKESPEFLRRVALIELAKRQTGNEAQKFQKAASILRVAKAAAAVTATPVGAAVPVAAPARNGHPTKEEWDEGGLARPTQRNGAKEPKGDGAAMAAVQQVMREKGFNTRIEATDEEADLPE